jgi:hypothetical protein
MSENTCKSCKWYKSRGGSFLSEDGYSLIEKGECRKNAPKDNQWWPLVLPSDFCGEFEK